MQLIKERLMLLKDEKYHDFQCKLMPTVNQERVIGVRTPDLRKLAKELNGSAHAQIFLNTLPHYYYDENNLHAFLIEMTSDFSTAIAQVDRFLTFVDNWATCDSMSPKVFKKNTDKLYTYIERWLKSKHTYTVRYGIVTLMKYYLDKQFKADYLEAVSNIKSDEYYINMASAWFFATALTKQYSSTITYFTDNKLDTWVHNKAIQKAIESQRVLKEQKEYLRKLKK